jgi:hypothetical protein
LSFAWYGFPVGIIAARATPPELMTEVRSPMDAAVRRPREQAAGNRCSRQVSAMPHGRLHRPTSIAREAEDATASLAAYPVSHCHPVEVAEKKGSARTGQKDRAPRRGISPQRLDGESVHTWVKSQWKNRPLPGQFSAEINTVGRDSGRSH